MKTVQLFAERPFCCWCNYRWSVLYVYNAVMLIYFVCTHNAGFSFLSAACWVRPVACVLYAEKQAHISCLLLHLCHSCIHFSNICCQTAIKAFLFFMHDCQRIKRGFEISETHKGEFPVWCIATEQRNFPARFNRLPCSSRPRSPASRLCRWVLSSSRALNLEPLFCPSQGSKIEVGLQTLSRCEEAVR